MFEIDKISHIRGNSSGLKSIYNLKFIKKQDQATMLPWRVFEAQ
jgi:hypothetical protein